MCAIKKIPCDVTIDNSLSMLLEGYCFIQNRCDRYKTDIFKTRLLGQKANLLYRGAMELTNTEHLWM